MERLIVEAKEIDACVGRLCDELNILQEQVGRLDDNMKIQCKMQYMLFMFLLVLIIGMWFARF